jgi:peptide deformylase
MQIIKTKLGIALLGEPVLRQIASLIDDAIQQLAEMMLFTLEGSNGVGACCTTNL